MISTSNEHIKASLACTQQLRRNVCRTAEEFKHLRKNLLHSLQPKNPVNVRLLSISITFRITNISIFSIK